MATKTPRADNLYANLLQEIKIRINCIESTLASKTGLPGQVIQEFCFLQLRIICELIALGCLVAHGDIEETTKLKGKWEADVIMNQLEKLHSDFYPIPTTEFIMNKNSGLQLSFDDLKAGFITKTELLELYGRCGGILHRGSLKKLLSPKMPIRTNFSDITAWLGKISNLLNFHRITLLDGETQLLCILENPANNNLAQVVTIKKILFPPIKPPLQP